MPIESITPIFVEEIPPSDELEVGRLYISFPYGTAVHLCACGCGQEVVTPLSPQGWKLVFNGKFSLTPSIGNFQFPCRSHYFIAEEEIRWCPDTSDFYDCPYVKSRKKKGKSKKKKVKTNFFKKLFSIFG